MLLRNLAALALMASAAPAAQAAEGGTLVIVGGGLDAANSEVWTALLEARPAGAPGIAIIPAASGEAAASAEAAADALLRHGANAADIVTIRLAAVDDPATSEVDESTWSRNGHDPGEIAAIRRAGAIWFTGGDQARIAATLIAGDGSDTPMLAAIRQRLMAGAVVGGTSAGAAIMSEIMIAQGDTLGALLPASGAEPLVLTRGLGFLPDALVDQHFGERARLGRLAAALTDPVGTQRIGLGIDEDTALVVALGERRARVAGNGYVTLLDARRAARLPDRRIGIEGLMLGLAGAGDVIDLEGFRVAPAPIRKRTLGREYVERPLPDGGGMGYGDQSLAGVVGEGLLDNAAATRAERVTFAGSDGVIYRFVETPASRGWWGRDDAGRARYTIDGVAFDISPVSVEIRKATN